MENKIYVLLEKDCAPRGFTTEARLTELFNACVEEEYQINDLNDGQEYRRAIGYDNYGTEYQAFEVKIED